MSDIEIIDLNRRKFLEKTTAALGAVGLVALATPFLSSWLPSAKTLAQGGPVEVDVTALPEGGLMTIPWRGQPIWLLRRSSADLDTLKQLDSQLRDPLSDYSQQPQYAKNEHRSIKPEILVLIGLCTHLGCVPVHRPEKGSLNAGWLGGFYCPCHGSSYDLAGRVFKGVPAPLNLIVPPHQYIDQQHILIGEDAV